MATKEMGYLDHIAELRRRLLLVVVTLLLAAIAAFSFSAEILDFLMGPARDLATSSNSTLVVLRPSEAFYVHLQVAVATAVAVNVPIMLYQILAFIFPGLTSSEKKWVWISIGPVLGLFVGGMMFAWFVVVPVIYRFFMGFTSETLQPFISIGNYISFITGIVVPFGVVFELPVVIALLTGIGLVTPMLLSRIRKFAILVIFVVAAFITPPDAVSQTLLALPLLGLYEASIGVSKVIYRRKERKRARLEAEMAALEEEAVAAAATAEEARAEEKPEAS